MLKQIDGKWVILSKKTLRPLAYYKGEGKPSDEWVKKQEARIQSFKHGGQNEEMRIDEAAYVGNIGIMELIKFYQKATPDLVAKVKKLIAQKKNKEAWEIIQAQTGVKLIGKEFNEAVDPDILPVSGAGQEGTDTLVRNYMKDTPGQNVASFRDWRNKTKHK
jgi:hypothetical protein